MEKIDQAAFGRLVAESTPKLRGTIRRLVGHPDETDDLVQQALLKAWEGLDSFVGSSAFSTWLCAIGSNLAVDHLRRQKRWRAKAQVAYANECLQNEVFAMEIGQVYASPSFAYDVDEHISYCFACVGRSLNPDEYAAVVLREILDQSNHEAAKTLGVTESVLRHRLAAGRRVLADEFEGLCSLVNKQGVCYQCKGLRDIAPEDRRGAEPPADLTLEKRLKCVAAARDDGQSKELHDLFWRRTRELEAEGRGSTEATGCGEDT
jgi:RNA polymerase sigma-70 factor (ECF subfamily)